MHKKTRIYLTLAVAAACLVFGYFVVRHLIDVLSRKTWMEMVLVPGGTFTMGATDKQIDFAYEEELPAHQVTVDSFYMGKYEVTYSQFAQFVAETGYLTMADTNSVNDGPGSWVYRDGKDVLLRSATWRTRNDGSLCDSTDFNHPVLHVTRDDAAQFCKWLSKKEGKPYRLPTEAEWEFAARGGNLSKGTLYSGSDDLSEVAWSRENSEMRLHEVGLLKPNELGLYDMSGNAWEWVSDWFGKYPSEPQINPQGPDFVKDSVNYSIARGGSWYRYASFLRNTDRRRFRAYLRGGGAGFRVVYSLEK